VLVVDDEDANVHLLERLLSRWGFTNVVSTTDSSRVLSLYATFRPDVLLLDLQMPTPTGLQVMESLADDVHGPVHLPILVLTADATLETKQKALAEGARDFLTKPFDPTEVKLRLYNLLETRRLQLALQIQNETLEQRVRSRTRDLDLARLETLERLALAGEYRDDNTHEHAQRVGRTVGLLAQQLGEPTEVVERLRRAAPLHDIGKVGVSDVILLKPGPLDAAEYEVMKSHATIGHQILSGSRSRVLQVSAEIALSHHEHWSGDGYPHGLAGDAIPFVGRMTAVADVFDALTHRRPYKDAWPVGAATEEIRRGAGSHFDPEVVSAFLALDPKRLLAPVGGEGGPVPAPSLAPLRNVRIAR
jgi:putative two-component system response regulator